VRRRALLVLALTATALWHAALVWPRYAVGSFDDDASYLLSARALAAGHGLTHHLPVGLPLAATYPPGYPALVAPLVRLAGGSFVPERSLSLALLAALLPLTWLLLRRRGVGTAPAAAVLALMALDPVLATYSVMVMAELPFLVLLLVVLLAADRWDAGEGRVAGVVTVLGAGSLVLVKQAGLGVVAGLALWFLLRRHPRRAVLLAAGVAVLLAPVVVARSTQHTPLLGARYGSEIGGPLAGGLLRRLTTGLPDTLHSYAAQAIPDAVVPVRWAGGPLLGAGAALDVLATAVTLLAVVGAVVWQRRHGGPVVAVVGVYALETLAFPFVNERRVVLVLPLVLAFVVAGAVACLRRGRALPLRAAGVAGLAAWAAIVLVAQVDRNYLFPAGAHSSQPLGSPYLGFLSTVAAPGDLVETDYVWTVALETGLRTSGEVSSLNPLLSPLVTPDCRAADVRAAVESDQPAWLLSGAFASTGIGAPCLLGVASTAPWAVRLLRTGPDLAAVFELVGPGSSHPGLRDLTAGTVATVGGEVAPVRPEPAQAGEDPGAFPVVVPGDAPATVTQEWGSSQPVSQVSVGVVSPEPADPLRPSEPGPGVVTRTTVQLHQAGGWVDVATTPGYVGPGGSSPYVVVSTPTGTTATGVRVQVEGSGTVGVHDLHALGGTVGGWSQRG